MKEMKGQIDEAIKYIDSSLSQAEKERRTILSSIHSTTKKHVKETLEANPTLPEAAERIDRLVLFQQLLRNIRMNLTTFRNAKLNLRINQIKSIKKLIEFLQAEGHGGISGYIKQPTGAGKTVLFGVLTHLCSVQTLILVPKTNLLTQTKKELIDVIGIPEEMIGLIGGSYKDCEKPIRIATYQSHRSLILRDEKYRTQVQSCQLVVCDEAHRSLGKQTQDSLEMLDGEFDDLLTDEEQEAEDEVLKNLENYTSARGLKLGFTATPKLAAKHVEKAFGPMIAEEKHADLVKAGILVPYKIVHTDGTITEEDLEDGYLTEEKEVNILQRENTYQKLLGEYVDVLAKYRKTKKRHQYPLRGAAFCVKISECDRFANEAKTLGLRSRVVTSRETKSMNPDEAEEYLKTVEQQLLNQEIDLIVTVTKLAEGWNFPPANAAIWARASQSPALIMQGVGRTARSYQDEKGRQKDFSYVFETDWHTKGKTRRSVPLTIADALAEMGESPEDCCSMADGSELVVRTTAMLDEDGIVLFHGEECVGLRSYGEPLGVKADTLQSNVEKMGIESVGNALSRSGHEIPIYRKLEIDSLECIQNSVTAANHRLNEKAEVVIQDKLGVGCPKYADVIGTNRPALKKEIKEAKLKPIGKARSGPTVVDVYLKSEIDSLESVQRAIAVGGKILLDDGTIDMDGVPGVGCPTYTGGLSKKFFLAALAKSKLKPIGKAKSGSSSVDVYVKEDIDKLVRSLKLQPNATVETEHGVGVGLTAYANILGISPKTLCDIVIDQKKLCSIGKAVSGTHEVDVYLKRAVDDIPEIQELLKNLDKKLDERGILVMQQGEVIGAKAYARHIGCSGGFLENLIQEYKIAPVEKVLSGSNEVDAYPKNLVDDIPEVKEYLTIKKIPIDENGIVDWEGISGVGLNRYSKCKGTMAGTLNEAVREAGIRPLGKIKSGTNSIDIYPKAEVDELPLISSIDFPLDERGIVRMKQSYCVGLAKYADFLDVDYQTLVNEAEGAGLEFVGWAKSGNKTIKAYAKSEVDGLPCIKNTQTS